MMIADLVPDVLVDVPGCPRATVRERIVEGARQTAGDTLAWDEELDRLEVSVEQDEIGVFSPQDAEIHIITSAEIDGRAVVHAWNGASLLLRGRHRAGLLIVRGALIPLWTAVTLPEALVRWREPILDYARFRLLMMPRQEWANPELAYAFRRQYEDRVTDARIEVARSRTTQPLRVRAQTFI